MTRVYLKPEDKITARIYLKPGDIVTASFVDLVVVQEAKGYLGYAISHLGDTELRLTPDGQDNPEGYGCEIKYAWELNPKDEHYGKPYYERGS